MFLPERERATLVRSVDKVADRVRSFTLVPVDGEPLPQWEPGAHVDLLLPGAGPRQYSLCGDPADRLSYRIAVLLEEEGRGGSVEVHETLLEGSELTIRGPRNHFALREAPGYLFVAGGIGITPMLPMLASAEAADRPARLVYGGRSLDAMAFSGDLARRSQTHLVAEDVDGLPDLAAELDRLPDGHEVYACGPEPMLVALEELTAARGITLHLERFGSASNPPVAIQEGDTPLRVVLQRSGITIDVPADRTVLDVVREQVPDAEYDCEEGYCGMCEVRVLGGLPLHRDTVLDDEQKAENDIMMICVGRALSDELVIDL